MPGFPIRTSSDQRFIDNSPRLNAALHVLHRLSMPRHPPCALNNEHTTTTNNHHTTCSNHQQWREHTKHKQNKEISQTMKPTTNKRRWQAHGLMLASTIQFSHNTPHNPTTTTNKGLNTVITIMWVIQPGNNAPDTQQCTKYFLKNVSQPFWLRCISTRLSTGGSRTIVYINHQPHNTQCHMV